VSESIGNLCQIPERALATFKNSTYFMVVYIEKSLPLKKSLPPFGGGKSSGCHLGEKFEKGEEKKEKNAKEIG
jgi:hypothetical protein